MTLAKFYKTKFKPAFNAYIRRMKKSGVKAVANSYDICALKELNARLENESEIDDGEERTEFTACDVATFIEEFLEWFRTDEFGSDIFSCSDARSEAFDSFFARFEEEWCEG